jgi:hypothetical protein
VAAVVAAVVAVPTGGCVGSVTPREVGDEARARGGGLSEEVVFDAVAAVAGRLDVDDPADLRIQSVTVALAHVVLEVVAPGDDGGLVSFEYGTSTSFGGHGLDGGVPVALTSTRPPLDTTVFTLADIDLDRLDEVVDGAVESSGLADAYAALATVARASPGTPPVVTVSVTDRRTTVEVDVPTAPEEAP